MKRRREAEKGESGPAVRRPEGNDVAEQSCRAVKLRGRPDQNAAHAVREDVAEALADHLRLRSERRRVAIAGFVDQQR